MSEPMPFGDFLDLAGVPVSDGSFVTERAMRIVEIVRDYDPNLDVEWVPREHRIPGDDAIRIVDTTKSGLARLVMSFADETELDERVIERLFLADATKQGDVLAQLEARNAAVKAVELKAYLDQKEAGLDLMTHALRSPLGRYSYRRASGEKVTFE